MMQSLAAKLNQRAENLCAQAMESADWLDIRCSQVGKVRLLDFASQRVGQLNSGLLLAKICLADLATVRLTRGTELGLPMVEVHTDHPLWACIAAQYAGWPFSHNGFFAMGSGPARMARGEEELLLEYQLVHPTKEVVGVFEADRLPTESEAAEFLSQCNAERGSLCLARTASLPGAIQVVARSVETTLHKLHELGFDLRKIKSAFGAAPLPPIPADDLTALGWTNDSILYGAETTLWVDATDEEINQIGEQLPSCSSSEFGRPFLEIFDECGRDFYKIDRMLFSPAKAILQSLQSGNTFSFGRVRCDILTEAFRLGVGSVS